MELQASNSILVLSAACENNTALKPSLPLLMFKLLRQPQKDPEVTECRGFISSESKN